MSDIQGPGWYHGEGDPAGTKRYWDGSQWVGEPQVMQDTPATTAGAAMHAGGRTPASFGSRVLAYLIDAALLIPVYIVFAIIAAVLGAISEGLATLVILLGYLAIFALVIYLYGFVQGVTGQTPGKRIMGIEVIKKDTGAYMGGGLGVGRYFANIINSIPCYLGWLWPLWDKDNQTLSDKIVGTQVVEGNKGGLLPLFPDGNPF